ncbi:TPA: lipocalin family protein, partial [Vibrio cholerae]
MRAIFLILCSVLLNGCLGMPE